MDAAKQAKISALILSKVAEGMSPREALDAVCGPGTFAKLAGDLYTELRAKAGR